MIQLDKDVYEFYMARLVERWHNKPTVPRQTNSDHSFGMLLLLLKLHPNPSADLMEAIIRHDLSEVLGGDFPHKSKKEHPVLKEIDEAYHVKYAEIHGMRVLNLSETDYLWVTLMDQLEPLYYLLSLKEQGNTSNNDLIIQCNERVVSTIAQLKIFGYFTEPNETKH